MRPPHAAVAAVAVVIAVAGCAPAPAPTGSRAPGGAAAASPEPPPPGGGSAAPPESSAKRKRARTSPAAPPERDGTKPKSGRTLNPKDSTGRTVFVRADDHCYVETKDGPEIVDCPSEASDPAYDHCTTQIVLEQGTAPAKCYCVTGAGPHRMPHPTPCPKL